MIGKLLNLKQVAELLGVSRSWVEHNWPSWIGYGVRPIRLGTGPKASLRFRAEEIEKMLKQMEVVRQ